MPGDAVAARRHDRSAQNGRGAPMLACRCLAAPLGQSAGDFGWTDHHAIVSGGDLGSP
jgi:hypothetical protein